MKLRFLLSLALCFAVASADAAIKTSTTSGNLSSGSTWVGGVAPTTGDQIIIANGHTVTIDSNIDLGVSPPQTPVSNHSTSATTATNATALAAGTYQTRITYVAADGSESHPNVSISVTVGAAPNNKPRVTVRSAALPSGVSSINLYVSNTGGAAGTERLYASGITGTTYDLESASWTNGTTTFAAATAVPDKRAITVNAGGSLTWGGAYTVTARGDVVIGPTSGVATITGTGGGVLSFDPSSANSPSNASYALWLAHFSNFGSNWAKLLTTGTTQSSRFRIETASGSNAPAFISRGVGQFGLVDSQYIDVAWCDLLRIGSSSVQAITLSPSNAARPQTFKWQGGVWDTCGTVAPGGAASSTTNSDILIRSITTKNTVGLVSGTKCPLLIGATTALGTGTRHLGGCVFDERVTFNSQVGFTIGEITEGDGWGNLFYKTFNTLGSSPAVQGHGNLIRTISDNGEAPIIAPDMFRNYFLADYVGTNPHFCGGGFSGTTHNLERNIFEFTGTSDDGDCFLHFNWGTTYNLKNNIITLNGDASGASGTLFTMGSNVASQVVNIEHNTMPSGLQAGAQVGEGTPQPHAGQLGSFKSNLIYRLAGVADGGELGPYKLSNSGGFTQATMGTSGLDIIDPVNADYNCGAGFTQAGFAGNHYNLNESDTPGTNDIDLANVVAVGFTDYTRRLAEWDASLGGTGTRSEKVAHAIAELSKRNDAAGYNSDYAISDLFAYVEAGHAPTNASLQDAGHDGVTIGAVEGVFGVSILAPTVDSKTRTTVTLSWSDATGGTPPYTYDIQQSPAGADTWTTVATDVTSPHTVTGLTAGTSYDFRIHVTDSE